MLNINNRYYKRSMQQNGKNISNFPRLLHSLETSRPVPEAMHNKEAGFTLIEVIVTMLIAGILATIAGLSIVQGVKGYVFASETAAITQKAELALARMSLELRDISDVTEASETKIEYKCAVEPEVGHTIELVGSEITIDTDDDLVDEVKGLVLRYYKKKVYNEVDKEWEWNDWDINSDTIEKLLVIHIDLILDHTDPDIPDGITFSTTINPRNTF